MTYFEKVSDECVLNYRKIDFNAVGEINYRQGGENVFAGGLGWDWLSRNYKLRDIGLTTGLKMNFTPGKHWLISFEAKYTRWLYIHDKGDDFSPYVNGTSPNTLTLKLGLGARF